MYVYVYVYIYLWHGGSRGVSHVEGEGEEGEEGDGERGRKGCPVPMPHSPTAHNKKCTSKVPPPSHPQQLLP